MYHESRTISVIMTAETPVSSWQKTQLRHLNSRTICIIITANPSAYHDSRPICIISTAKPSVSSWQQNHLIIMTTEPYVSWQLNHQCYYDSRTTCIIMTAVTSASSQQSNHPCYHDSRPLCIISNADPFAYSHMTVDKKWRLTYILKKLNLIGSVTSLWRGLSVIWLVGRSGIMS